MAAGLSLPASALARDFCAGFEQGYKTSFKSSSNSALDPLTPPCPPQPPKLLGDPESDYEHGYVIGFRSLGPAGLTSSERNRASTAPTQEQRNRQLAPRSVNPTRSAERWMHLLTSDNAIVHADTASLRVFNNEVTAWIRRTPVRRAWRVMPDDERIQYQHEFSRIHFNCDSWEITILSSYITDALEKQLALDRQQVGPFIVSPTSLYDGIINAACQDLAQVY